MTAGPEPRSEPAEEEAGHVAIRAIDLWVNTGMGQGKPPEWLVRVKEDYFRAGAEFFRSFTPDELLAEMDEAGVEKAVLSVGVESPDPKVLDFPRRHPERFSLAACPDPRKLMPELWRLEALVKEHPVTMARVSPFTIDTAPSDPVYYPLYAKCVELDLPLAINTGLPGPPCPGDTQDPMHLDRVCFRFPELKLCMAHGADPWWGVAIRLMIKYKNLRLMTSAYSPRHFPAELVHFMNTRGQDKILFASDHPVLSFKRCIAEAQQLELRPGVLEKFLYGNAESFFFAPRHPRY
jgi:predicted TIM-barrel fold metal-dependent hydrolase